VLCLFIYGLLYTTSLTFLTKTALGEVDEVKAADGASVLVIDTQETTEGKDADVPEMNQMLPPPSPRRGLSRGTNRTAHSPAPRRHCNDVDTYTTALEFQH
jgi:hypothetical protein